MSQFFTNHFRTALAGNQTIMDTRKIKLVLFRYAPAMGTLNTSWTAARTVAELVTQPGWVEATNVGGYPLILELDVGTRVLGGSKYVMFSSYPFTGLTETAEVRAIGIVYIGTLNTVVNPLIFVTNTPIGEITNLAPTDALTASPDSTFPDATNRWLLGWSTTTPDPQEGPLVFSRGSPEFEVSGSQHAWLYPQRANMVANPSFEKPGTSFWSTNGVLSRVSGGAPGGGAWAGQALASVAGHLTPMVGTVTTPDPGPLPAEYTFVFTVQGPTGATGTVAAQSENHASDRSWTLIRRNNDGGITYTAYATGAATPTVPRTNQIVGVTPEPQTLAMALKTTDGVNGQSTAWQYINGAWTAGTTGAATGTFVTKDSALVVRIGGITNAATRFDGRIYNVELRSGLTPTGGTVLWRFDAAEYPGTGTSYVDPRGRTWTLTTASAITPTVGSGLISGYAVMESNIFPTRMGELDSEHWTIQLMAKGSGRLKVGFVYWDADYRLTGADWGVNETWTLSPTNWTHIATHRRGPEAHIAMVRLELEGTSLLADKVLAERGYLKDWLYFDGDEKYGARDDFSWYGGTNRQGATYSLWYNHRKAVTGRLFARTVDPNDPSANVTDEDMEEQGLVYRWVPAGITVVPHMDVFYPFDVRNPLPAKAAGVLPHYSLGSPDGVHSPWV